MLTGKNSQPRFLRTLACLGLWLVCGGTAAAAPQITFAPPDIDFGTVETKSTATVTMVLANPGDETLTVSDFQKTGSVNFFLDTDGPADPCGTTRPEIEAGESCEIAVNFSPSDTETFTGALQFTSNDPEAPVQVVDLIGNGLGSDCSLGGSGAGSPTWLIWPLMALGFIWVRRERIL